MCCNCNDAYAMYIILIYFIIQIMSVIVSVLASSPVDRGREPRSGQTKTVELVFVASPLSTQH